MRRYSAVAALSPAPAVTPAHLVPGGLDLGKMVVQSALVLSLLVAVFCFAISAGAAPAEAQAEAQAAVPQPADEPCQISSRYPESIQRWCGLITTYAAETGLEADLIAAVMLQESGGDALAYSHSGAVGLMQVMPRDGLAANFQCVNGPCFASRPTIEELQDPEFNIAYGTRMLAGLVTRFDSLRDGLKAYGPRDGGYYYADKVLKIYENYKE
jgi:soluble lytic murein transglycosylase-like protein